MKKKMFLAAGLVILTIILVSGAVMAAGNPSPTANPVNAIWAAITDLQNTIRSFWDQDTNTLTASKVV